MHKSHELMGATDAATATTTGGDSEPDSASPPVASTHAVTSHDLKPVEQCPGSLRLSSRSSRPQLLSRPTTAVSLAGVHGHNDSDAASLRSSPASRAVSRKPSLSHLGRTVSVGDIDDASSLRSFAPTLQTAFDKLSLLGNDTSQAWQALSSQLGHDPLFAKLELDDEAVEDSIVREFEPLHSASEAEDETTTLQHWKDKLKHFFILSASGKPIYSRHGDDNVISHYIGVVQTLVSSYQSTSDPLNVFYAGNTTFLILTKGPLTLVAISKLDESARQLQTQLESLYMQILSTLTLPTLEKMFSNRPSTDLRRPLEGTDVLLDGLTEGFTRGSASTLLSALECLRLRKTHRRVINDTLLKVRSPNLVYGLIVAAGRLVSVVRPKKHSLHPGDLHLIFNMLFEAGGVKAGGGENWIPLCLPGFNNTGYVYMYVSFVTADDESGITPVTDTERPSSAGRDDEIAVIFISANKESFFELRKMRNDLLAQLNSNGSMTNLKSAIAKGQATCASIVPGTVLRHFLYKSRGNVQFVMPSLSPDFAGIVARRKLMSLYHTLHEAVHSRTSHLKVQHLVSQEASALAWETPLFELYCIAGAHIPRAAICQGANRVVQWIRREEERVFIIGGAVF